MQTGKIKPRQKRMKNAIPKVVRKRSILNVTLSDKSLAILEKVMAAGKFRSRSRIIDEALALWSRVPSGPFAHETRK